MVEQEKVGGAIEKISPPVPVPTPEPPKRSFDKSDSIVNLAKALAAAQAEIKTAVKTKINPYFKSKYADLDEVWGVCRLPLTKNGLSIVQTVDCLGQMVSVTTILLHASGEYITGKLTLQAENAKPQPVGSAITYARRYSLSAMVGISADEEDDGNGKKVKTDISELNSPLDGILQKNILKAKEKLGNEKFMEVLGSCGYSQWEEIPNATEAKKVLDEMKKVFEENK